MSAGTRLVQARRSCAGGDVPATAAASPRSCRPCGSPSAPSPPTCSPSRYLATRARCSRPPRPSLPWASPGTRCAKCSRSPRLHPGHHGRRPAAALARAGHLAGRRRAAGLHPAGQVPGQRHDLHHPAGRCSRCWWCCCPRRSAGPSPAAWTRSSAGVRADGDHADSRRSAFGTTHAICRNSWTNSPECCASAQMPWPRATPPRPGTR